MTFTSSHDDSMACERSSQAISVGSNNATWILRMCVNVWAMPVARWGCVRTVTYKWN